MQYVYEESTFLDERCYTTFGLSPEVLMEHAGFALARAVKKKLTCKKRVLFVCGMGNNGADGMVAARLLHGRYDVKLYLPFKPKSDLAKLQYERAKNVGVDVVEEMVEADIYVDALFGAGLNRALDDFTCKILETLNARKGYKIACDVPSGLLHDISLSQSIFCADETVCMGALKLGLLHDRLKDYVGKLRVANLGVARTIYEVPSCYFLLQKRDLALPFRKKKNSNKGTFGHVVVVQGKKVGAARLAGMGAFHFGAGLVTLLGAPCGKTPAYLMYSQTLPLNANVIVAGMGLEMSCDDVSLKALLLETQLPLVVDASLLHQPFIHTLIETQKPLVLTPHPKEFVSLLNITCKKSLSVETLQSNRFEYAKSFSERYPHVVLVLKGANTIIAHKGELFINPYGTQALAKGGSGDVLAGMIGALIAQGYSLKEAAMNASLAHALVARNSAYNNFSLTPIDICKGLQWL